MISRLTPRFKKAFEKLPKSVQVQAKTAYQLWQRNPAPRSLPVKPVLTIPKVYAVRIGIGSHEEYNKLLKRW